MAWRAEVKAAIYRVILRNRDARGSGLTVNEVHSFVFRSGLTASPSTIRRMLDKECAHGNIVKVDGRYMAL